MPGAELTFDDLPEPAVRDAVGPGFPLFREAFEPQKQTLKVEIELPQYPGAGTPPVLVIEKSIDQNIEGRTYVQGVPSTVDEYHALVKLIEKSL